MTRVALACLLVSRIAAADLANNDAIHAHVDALLAIDPHPALADRVTLSLGTLIPIYGSYELDERIFGDVRPSAVVFDWILGGAAPIGLGIAALATHGTTRELLGWTAIGLYATTRLGVLIFANLHVTEFDRYLKLRLGVAETRGGQPAPAIVAATSW